MERELASLRDRPLVGTDQHACVTQRCFRQVEEPAPNFQDFWFAKLAHPVAGVGKDGDGPATAEAVRRSIHDGQERHAAGALAEIDTRGGLGWGEPDAGQIERRSSLESRFRRQPWHVPGVDHRDARDEPHDEHQAQGNAQITVDQDQRLPKSDHW